MVCDDANLQALEPDERNGGHLTHSTLLYSVGLLFSLRLVFGSMEAFARDKYEDWDDEDYDDADEECGILQFNIKSSRPSVPKRSSDANWHEHGVMMAMSGLSTLRVVNLVLKDQETGQ